MTGDDVVSAPMDPVNRVDSLVSLAERLGCAPVQDGVALAVVRRTDDSPMYALDDIILALAKRMGFIS
jgi:hypothetical protein